LRDEELHIGEELLVPQVANGLSHALRRELYLIAHIQAREQSHHGGIQLVGARYGDAANLVIDLRFDVNFLTQLDLGLGSHGGKRQAYGHEEEAE
jgi:hypothetical protein